MVKGPGKEGSDARGCAGQFRGERQLIADPSDIVRTVLGLVVEHVFSIGNSRINNSVARNCSMALWLP